MQFAIDIGSTIIKVREIEHNSLKEQFLYERDFSKKVNVQVEEIINAIALNPNNKFITKKIVNKIQSNNIKVFPYTINSPKNIKRMKLMGVDAIITDYPERINK